MSTAPSRPVLVITPPRRWAVVNLREVWAFRDLLTRFAIRDLKLRYRQTALGVVWVVLQPLIAAGVFSFVFGRVADLPSDGVPYFVFAYAGMLGWNLFSACLGKISGSLVGNAGLISKIYFPRLVLPLSTLGSTFVDFGVALVMMAAILVVGGVTPGLALITLPVWVALAALLGSGIGLVAAALMVSYRDVGYVLPVLTQILLYASPVAYAVSAVPDSALAWFRLNPLTGMLEGFRWALLDSPAPPTWVMAWSAGCAVVLFVVGATVFARMERRFADVI